MSFASVVRHPLDNVAEALKLRQEIEAESAVPAVIHERLGSLTWRRYNDLWMPGDFTYLALLAEEITPEFLEGIYCETEGNPSMNVSTSPRITWRLV